MIKVKGSDFEAAVGGDFKSALVCIKTFDGAKYNSATKTWVVSANKQQFRARMLGFPIDIGGTHYTRYGNPYGREEWADAKEEMKAEKERMDANGAKLEALKGELLSRCATFVGNREKASLLYALILGDRMGRSNFSIDEKYQKAKEIADWYEDARLKIFDANSDDDYVETTSNWY